MLAAAPALAQPSEDDKLNAFFKSYLDEHFRQQPLAATQLGDHRFDNLLDDISPAARAGWLALAEQTLRELPRQVDYQKLSRDGQIDFEIFQHNLQTQIWETKNLHPFQEDPRTYGAYINDSVYLLLTQSTLPKETNIANCLARMAQMPRIVAEAEKTLTHPPKPILETAIRQNQGAIDFYEKDIFQLAGDTAQLDQLKAAAASVAARAEGLPEIPRRSVDGARHRRMADRQAEVRQKIRAGNRRRHHRRTKPGGRRDGIQPGPARHVCHRAPALVPVFSANDRCRRTTPPASAKPS